MSHIINFTYIHITISNKIKLNIVTYVMYHNALRSIHQNMLGTLQYQVLKLSNITIDPSD
jgi:hypothetical protein